VTYEAIRQAAASRRSEARLRGLAAVLPSSRRTAPLPEELILDEPHAAIHGEHVEFLFRCANPDIESAAVILATATFNVMARLHGLSTATTQRSRADRFVMAPG
jgi:hypothetical protein